MQGALLESDGEGHIEIKALYTLLVQSSSMTRPRYDNRPMTIRYLGPIKDRGYMSPSTTDNIINEKAI